MDPLMAAGAAMAKAVGDAGESAAGEAGGLLRRALGPTADVLGEALARYAEFRLRNVAQIAEKSASKGQASGQVPPRVAHQILDSGSYCDDELMAEYLSGVLAGSRTVDGRDDRAVSWAALVNAMSTHEIRAHFLLYRAWAERLRGRSDLMLWGKNDQQASRLYVDMLDMLSSMGGDIAQSGESITHALVGLRRRDLIGDGTAWGTKDYVIYDDSPFDVVVVAELTPAGVELFGWVLGKAGVDPRSFVDLDLSALGSSLPSLSKLALPRLSAPDRDQAL